MKMFNKRARFEYELMGEGIEAGISLKGAEAKSIRENRGDISRSSVRILNGEAYLINANIPATGIQKYDPTRTRKLLLHKREIISILTKAKQQKLQIVPVRVYNKRSLRPNGRKSRLIKIYLELGKSKRKFEKKESIKLKDVQRDIETELKNSV
ncbi:MAG: SsrA-binding protein [Microgenomates group bacterium GW2011_GWC1_39_7b]|uniref:SsrA-binding protein n=3 Tax=Candidatus Woeseibacteriota TaxID=1752722 RepID=A0A0G0T7G0_9BACT|nr:MAG: SsrA-binding protein [Microgenomates group bacterium GW2011_GWC1_39_7b]KKR72934.1 MAG: SsrA-binding protein [Candidatus Woesebacteria bacterium GW2011_GWA2_40_7]